MSDLIELKNTYLLCIDRQKQVISINRQKLNCAMAKSDFEEMRRLRRLLNVLYDEKAELEYLHNCLRRYAEVS